MMMLNTAILILGSLLIAGASGGEYVITAPKIFQPGSNYQINVDILNKTNVLVVATIMEQVYNGLTGRNEFIPIQNGSGTFGVDNSGTISLPIRSDFKCQSCRVRIRGKGDLQFEQVTYAVVSEQVVVIIIQTDKAIYKPGQTVRYRVFAVYPDLLLYTGGISIDITDPNNNKIKVLKNATSPSGVVEDSFNLSDVLSYGTWTISVYLQNLTTTHSQGFEVSEYELSRYEVTVELPPYSLIEETTLTGKVKARYTFGQPVIGYVELHVGPNQGPNYCGELPKTTNIGFAIDGEASFSIPKEDIERAVSIYDRQEVKFTAFVTEETTGVRLNGSSVATFYSNNYQIKITDNTPGVFKAGLPYTAFILVTTPDNKPPTINTTISVYTTVNYQQTYDDQSLYSVSQFTGTYGLPGKNVTVPSNGLVTVDIDIPKNATSITIKASLNNVQVTKTAEKMFSTSNNYIQLSLLSKNVKSGSTAVIKIDGTEPLNKINYEILSRGSVAASGKLDGQGQKSFTFDLLVTAEFAPNVHFLVYYTRDNNEIIADSLTFKVENIFKNKVDISFNKNESEPNKDIVLQVTAEPGSAVFLAGVDQSVLLVKTGNDVTVEKVTENVLKFDPGKKPTDSEFALSSSSATVKEVFSDNGVEIITDIIIPSPPSRYERRYDRLDMGEPMAMYAYDDSSHNYAGPTLSKKVLEEVDHVRKFFPEVWMWSTAPTGENGTTSFTAVVPDTITSWIISGYAAHPTVGLGIEPNSAVLKVFRPFFVSLTHPNSVIRGEQVVILAEVFNYLPNKATVTVTMLGSIKFQSVILREKSLETLESGPQVKTIEIDSGKQGVVYFPILASNIGVVDIEITAQTATAADGIRKQITVKSGGAPFSYNVPVFVNLENNGSFVDSYDFPLPVSVVNGSDSARIKVTGDPIGPSLKDLTSLLVQPTGCGEQSMAHISANLYVAQYLKASSQMTPALEKDITDNLNAGYQRQLTYQRTDKGFSAFGNSDQTGSTWLTAYIIRVLYDVKYLIYLDEQVLISGTDWLVQRQNKDGSFNEFGKVLDSSTQGTGTGPALTAFVLLSLVKNSPLAQTDCTKDTDCNRAYSWGNATVNAVRYLEGLLDANATNDQFSLALISYALTVANSSKADVAYQKLERFAHRDGGLLYWSDNSTVSASQRSNYRIWQPPQIKARPIDNLITSYVILYLTAQNRVQEAIPAFRWLIKQRNALGGFASSQDTAVGIQAIAAYTSQSITPDTNLNIKVSKDTTTLAEFHIDQQNALTLQIKELSSAPSKATVTITGTGLGLIEIDTNFHIDKELTTPSFDVSTVLLDDELNSFNLLICSKWLWDRPTGMVVQKISIPSGFNPDVNSIGNVAGLMKSERSGSTVDVYFDKMSKTSVCYSIRMTRTHKVARIQENYVYTFDYYNPGDQSTIFWQSNKLGDSSVCDVCRELC